MSRRLQVFVSSTYLDLKEERQAAVEAILEAKHIPAGMELFAAGNDSQLEVIKRWIDESDVYMLILGHRYGSIEPKRGKSYTHVEYDYAVEKGKPVFAVVMTDGWRKSKQAGPIDPNSVIELENPKELKGFRGLVMGRICKTAEDRKDIKLAVHQSLADLAHRKDLVGWVRGDADDKRQELEKEIARLGGELAAAERQKAELEGRLAKAKGTEGPDWEAIRAALANITTDLTLRLTEDEKAGLKSSTLKKMEKATALEVLTIERVALVRGISNHIRTSSMETALFFDVAPHFELYGLIEEDISQRAGKVRQLRLSPKGKDFLIWLDQEAVKMSSSKASPKS